MKFLKGSKVYNKKTGIISTVCDYPIHESWYGYFTTEEEGKLKAFHDSDFCLVGSFEHTWIEFKSEFYLVIAILIVIYFITRLMSLFYV